jgi:cytochrome c oxidase assembly protein subunit 15
MNMQPRRAVGLWLLVIAAMIGVMVVLGGATRVSGSGLSIMEWAPLAGVLPPLSDAEWRRLFALYQQIPQYHLLHEGMGLGGFKSIFWLEWVHRLWGRLMGVAFFAPLVVFWARGRLSRRLALRLLGIFVLGGLQGAVGWFMVASGFFPDSEAVAPARLVIHLGLALAIYAAVLWTAFSEMIPDPPGERLALARAGARVTLALVALTILAGGFVAGLHAGLDYNTFPLMDGHLVPVGYARLTPLWDNFAANIAAVQFNHRLLATLSLLAALFTLAAGGSRRARLSRRARRALAALGGVILLQFLLGVTTLLLVVPAPLAVLHQAGAVLALTASLFVVYVLRLPASRKDMP